MLYVHKYIEVNEGLLELLRPWGSTEDKKKKTVGKTVIEGVKSSWFWNRTLRRDQLNSRRDEHQNEWLDSPWFIPHWQSVSKRKVIILRAKSIEQPFKNSVSAEQSRFKKKIIKRRRARGTAEQSSLIFIQPPDRAQVCRTDLRSESGRSPPAEESIPQLERQS